MHRDAPLALSALRFLLHSVQRSGASLERKVWPGIRNHLLWVFPG
jgi:hypothetical protein